MIETWVTSDTHFHHAALMKHYEDRGKFATIEELDEWMIDEWNARVKKNDVVFHMGDFGCFDINKNVEIVRRLNGKLHLVPGNHDRKLIKDERFQRRCSIIYQKDAAVSIEGQQIHLYHFPIWEWEQIHRGWWHLHGHLHAKPHGIPGKIMDAGADGNGLVPYHFDEVRAYMASRPVREHH